MSMSLVVGFLCAYPMNWWLVTRHLKHGMMTVRNMPEQQPAESTHSQKPHAAHGMAAMESGGSPPEDGHAMSHTPPAASVLIAGLASVVILAVAVAIVLYMTPSGG
jgi:hypothetical protein